MYICTTTQWGKIDNCHDRFPVWSKLLYSLYLWPEKGLPFSVTLWKQKTKQNIYFFFLLLKHPSHKGWKVPAAMSNMANKCWCCCEHNRLETLSNIFSLSMHANCKLSTHDSNVTYQLMHEHVRKETIFWKTKERHGQKLAPHKCRKPSSPQLNVEILYFFF